MSYGFQVAPWELRWISLDLDALERTESIFALSNGHVGMRGTLEEGEPRGLPGTGLLTSFFLWWKRGLTLHRLDAILRGRRTAPFRDLHDGLRVSAHPFIPAPAPPMASPLPG